MVDQCANGKSFSEKGTDSPLTMGELVAVLNNIFGHDISDRVMATSIQATAARAPLAEAVADQDSDADAQSTQDAETQPGNPAVTLDSTQVAEAKLEAQTANAVTSALQENPTPATRWYAVTVGKEVGVFTNWNVVAPFVVGVSGACYPRYPSRQAAEEAFQCAVESGTVRRIV